MSNQKETNNTAAVRIDKWLWAARFFKTRATAREMVQSGRVQYNGARAKPSKVVELGAKVSIPAGFDMKEVIIEKIMDKRQGAPIAQTLYRETEQSVKKREENKLARQTQSFHSPRPENKPDKKQRRELIKMKHQ
ncbi:RNA-binding S4 domain-containing protein [Alteromonas sp. a30]|uniref:RNA-binding S4 domain-containing protein n=1 Tax=Alteromonas sp. a30 TaxID=2730917 RepID=UPI002281453F|nr:S4 domain-containing protein [Alteromonas sp. a30]MCY7295674.1 heat-shock protein [Alteromonas sp. a30]